MSPEDIFVVRRIQKELRTLAGDSEPKGMIDGDEEGGIIVANEAGMLHLAASLLDSARGEDTAAPDWLDRFGWKLEGFQLRVDPEVFLPPRRPWLDHTMLVAAIAIICLIIWGFIDGTSRAWEWLMHLPG